MNALLSDLRERKLWPLAAALLAALVAVPVMLSQHPASSDIARAPVGVPVTSHSGPSVTMASAGGSAPLASGSRDPFTQLGGGTGTGTGTTRSTTVATATTTPGGSSDSSGSATTTTPTSTRPGSSGGSNPGTTPDNSPGGGSTIVSPALPVNPVTPGGGTVAPQPTGLTATQAYSVTITMSDGHGGLTTPTAPLARLSVFPSARQPALIELGVEKGGQRVLFATLPGISLSGPGTRIPGPLDCEIVALAPGQVEQVSTATLAPVLFTVAVSTQDYSTAAAARQARLSVSADGSHLLSTSTNDALSLFQYDPSLGALVDLRNLTVGGN